MQEIHSQSERLSQQLNEVGSKALANMMAALVQLSNREKNKAKSLQVTRKNPSVGSVTVSRTNSPAATMDSGFKVTRKDANNPDLSPQQQAEQSIERLNSLLPDRKYFQRDLDVNGTKYNFEKYRGGAISIQSQGSKLFAKQGKIRFQGDEPKLINDLPDIVARMERELDLERPKQINNRTEVLYGYDSNNNFIEKQLSQKDAQAILNLMDGKEGTTIAEGENLLIEYDGKKLFETDAQGVVTYSAYDRDPELLSSIKLKDEKGLTDLTNYAKRMAASPVGVASPLENREAKVTKTNPKSELVPSPPQEVSRVAPQSPIGKTLDRTEPTTTADPSQIASVTYDRVLKSEFAKVKPKSDKIINIEGTTFKLNRQTTKGNRSISVKPSKDTNFVKIGELDRDGNFKPDPNLNDPNVTKALDRVLAARGIDPRSVKAAQQLEVASQSKDPQSLPLTQENAPSPTPKIANTPSVNTPKPKPQSKNNSPELAATTGNAPSVATSNNESPDLVSTPANSPDVNVPTRGEKEAVRVPTSGGTPERSRPEPEVSQSR